MSVSWAATRLGLAEADVVAWAKGRGCGWSLVGAESTFLKFDRSAKAREDMVGGGPGLMQIADLAGYVVHLER